MNRVARLAPQQIRHVLRDEKQDQVNFLHTFNGNETRISVGRKEQTLFIRVDDYAAVLNPGQQVVFAALSQRIIERGCEQAPWTPPSAEGEGA